MKKRVTIAIAAAALAATATVVMAGGFHRHDATPASALPAYQIIDTVRSFGLQPTTQALRRGPYYVLHAIDGRGVQVRVVADASLGDIVSVSRLATPSYSSGPRIIHVPQPGESDADDAAAPDEENEAPPVYRPRPRPQRHSAAPPAQVRAKAEPQRPLGPPRNVLSAPPPSISLTPVYPTPRFGTKPEPAEKFGQPLEDFASSPPPAPPAGYTPPFAPAAKDQP